MEIPIVPNQTIPKPAKVAQAKAVDQSSLVPSDWWSIRDISGSVSGVIRAVLESKIPDHWKVAIKADIEARCGDKFNFVYLDVHYMTEKGKGVLHFCCEPDTKLL